jgi:hypothetical protein
MELENIILSEVSQVLRATCSFSYVEYRPSTNTSHIIKIGHTKESHEQEREGKRREFKR